MAYLFLSADLEQLRKVMADQQDKGCPSRPRDSSLGAEAPNIGRNASRNPKPEDFEAKITKIEASTRKKRRAAWAVTNGPVIGLSLSGGGIRSATFSLGVLRELSALGILTRFDYLSTVSGGSYVGSFFCGLFVPRVK